MGELQNACRWRSQRILLVLKNGRSLKKVLTENVSPHRARVVAKRRWPPGQQLRMAPLSDKSEWPMKVVYCRGLSSGLFCLVLEFGVGSIKWPEGP
jgi:hypothetical protein